MGDVFERAKANGIDWRFQSIFDNIDAHHASIRNGALVVLTDGRRKEWCTVRPSQEDVDKAKRDAKNTIRRIRSPVLRHRKPTSMSAYCPCCKTLYQIPSVLTSVAKHGVCEHCLRFWNGDDPGFIWTREPTLEEALAGKGYPRQAEGWVIKQELLRLRGQT